MRDTPIVMEPGHRYRVRTRHQAANYRWIDRIMVADYVGEDRENYTFSGRPEFGTTDCPKEWVVWVKEVDKDQVKCHPPQRAG